MADAAAPPAELHRDVEAGTEPREKYEIDIGDEDPSNDSDASVASETEKEEQLSPIEASPIDHSSNDNGEAISKVASKASVNNVSSIPNGGLMAWSQVLGGFLIMFNAWGIINTYGTYQTFYESGTIFQASSSNLSWIGALQACLLLLVGSLAGPVYDAGYFRYQLFVGSFLVVFGQMMLSLCKEYYQVLLAQAVCIGVGAGIIFVPGVAIISTYFSTRLAFAVGVAATGSSFGGVIYPVMFHKLIDQVGFAWTTRIIGFVELATLIVPNIVMKVRVLPAQKRKLFDWSAWKEPEYTFFVIGTFVTFMGVYVPFFYIQYYAIVTRITNPNLGFYLIAILNSTSVFGRILPNFLADKTGPLNMMVPCSGVTSILIFACIGIHSEAGIIVFCLLFGFFSGAFVSVPPAVFVTLSPTRGIIGTRMGMGFSVVSIGLLIGTPIAGAILGFSHNSAELDFTATFAYGGAFTAAGFLLILTGRMFKAKWKIWAKV